MEFLTRKVYFPLKEHLVLPEISLILGPRQAGKTTLMKRLAEELNQEGRPNTYFNLDIIEDKQYFVSQHTLIDQIKKRVGREAVVFIDEIQRLTNAGLFLKGLYDLATGYKLVVSGSGSLELKANIIEPMTGRKKIFYCLPLSFTEFALHKTNANFGEIEEVLESNPFETKRLISEYFLYGGYPRVVLGQTHEEKINVLSEIYKSYLEKDIQLLLGVEKDEAFQLLIKILASQVGKLINRAELSAIVGLNEKTVEKYLNLLEKTFVISLVKPYFTNVRKELRKSPKVYFLDLGFLSLAKGRLGASLPEGDVFENACFLRLKEKELLKPIHFWRSQAGAEVDFVLTMPKNGELLAVEAKISSKKVGSLGKSLRSFLTTYRPKEVYIYNRNLKTTIEELGVKIYYLPYHLLPDF